VRFCAGSVDVFVSCGADGSVRMFDLRSLEHSTIIYEPSEKTAERDKGKVLRMFKQCGSVALSSRNSYYPHVASSTLTFGNQKSNN